MSWQDVVLGSGILLFNLALIPSILSRHKPALATSVLNGIVLAAFVITYVTMSMWLTVIGTALNAFLWFVLAAQQWRIHHRPRRPS